MAATDPGQVVYSDVVKDASETLQGQLFHGIKFWVAQRCPSRSQFIADIRANGGEVVPLEKQADYLIVDHMRKDTPPGGISFNFITESLKHGQLEDPAAHAVGPPKGAIRDVGSSMPSRSNRRIPYTAEDDRILWEWVEGYKRKGGTEIRGNRLYKGLEEKCDRHPWQSWKDRYLKQLVNKPPVGVSVSVNPRLSPPSEQHTEKRDRPLGKAAEESKPAKPLDLEKEANGNEEAEIESGFTQQDYDDLYRQAEHIANLPSREYVKIWEERQRETGRDAKIYREYFEQVVLRDWERKRGSGKQDHAKVEEASRDTEEADQPPKKTGDTGGDQANEVLAKASPVRKEQKVEVVEEEVIETVTASAPSRSQHSKSIKPVVISSSIADDRHSSADTPRSAYEFFSEEHRHLILQEHPGLQRHQVSQLLIERYGALSPRTKARYEAKESSRERDHAARYAHMSPTKKRPRKPESPKSSPERKRFRLADVVEDAFQKLPEPFVSGKSDPESIPPTGSSDRALSQTLTSPQSRTQLRTEGSELGQKEVEEGGEEDHQSQQQEVPRELERLEGGDGTSEQRNVQDEYDSSSQEARPVLDKGKAPMRGEYSPEDTGYDLEVPEPDGYHSEEGSHIDATEAWEYAENEVGFGSNPALLRGHTKEDAVEITSSVYTTSSEEELEEEANEKDGLAEEAAGVGMPTPLQNDEDEDEAEEESATRRLRDSTPTTSQVDLLLQEQIISQMTSPTDTTHRPRTPILLDIPSDSPHSSRSPTPVARPHHVSATNIDTQAILSLETQEPDLSVAMPDGLSDLGSSSDAEPDSPERRGEEEYPDRTPDSNPPSYHYRRQPPSRPQRTPHPRRRPSPSPAPSTASSASTSIASSAGPLDDAELRAYTRTLCSQGHALADVVRAVHATGMHGALARTVLEDHLSRGRPLPEDVRGVWTARDDADLEGGDARGTARVERKHGWAACEERMEFLEGLREGRAALEDEGVDDEEEDEQA